MDVASLTKVGDRVESSLPFAYFPVRFYLLALSLVGLVAWFGFGFDIKEGAVPLLGIQWSTFATFFFFMYLMMASFGKDGLRGIKDDFKFIQTKASGLDIGRENWPQSGDVGWLRASLYSFLVCLGCLFLFEAIWVPLYDYFQFGSLMWPVYYAISPSLFSYFGRNMLLTIAPLMLAPLILLITAIDGDHFRFKLKPRLDWLSFSLLGIAALLWVNWIFFPHQAQPLSISGCFVFPSQGLFPQNTYTYYPCSADGAAYPLKAIQDFFVPNDGLHAVNVLTKFFTFAAVCYPAMLRVKRR